MTIDPVAWVTAAAADCGVTLDRPKATILADRLATAGGLPGVEKPSRIPPALSEAWANRDLYEDAHRTAFTGLAATVATDIPGLAEAVYERCVQAHGWEVYPDALPTLTALYAAGVKIGVVSNIGFDIRPLLDVWGLSGLCDCVVLSYEVGYIKPDPKIFLKACAQLGADPAQTLMVGDTQADAGATGAGCSALILSRAPAGQANGLSRAYHLAKQR